MAYSIHWEPIGVYRKYRGHVTGDELLASIQLVESDARFDALRYAINDCLDVESFDISDSAIRKIAAIDQAAALSNPNIRVAVVATDQQIHALAQLYAAQQPTYPTAIFHELDTARLWIREAPVLTQAKPTL
jgi:hypothetical protein